MAAGSERADNGSARGKMCNPCNAQAPLLHILLKTRGKRDHPSSGVSLRASEDPNTLNSGIPRVNKDYSWLPTVTWHPQPLPSDRAAQKDQQQKDGEGMQELSRVVQCALFAKLYTRMALLHEVKVR